VVVLCVAWSLSIPQLRGGLMSCEQQIRKILQYMGNYDQDHHQHVRHMWRGGEQGERLYNIQCSNTFTPIN
jgi:hypothetical protein